ncbi:MAG TPA: serine hydrolase, partial [Blastocatellia bacterium]|nr:serine hydrolase [Blastocatellia bacterium]
MIKNKLFVVLCVIAAAGFAVKGQAIDTKLAAIDAYAQKVLVDQGQPGMAIAVVRDDKVVFAQGYGTKELGKNSPVDANT